MLKCIKKKTFKKKKVVYRIVFLLFISCYFCSIFCFQLHVFYPINKEAKQSLKDKFEI